MVLKRNFVEEDRLGFEDNPLRESKRRFSFDTVVRDVMKGLSIQELVSRLEPLLRKVVREELERVIPYIHSVPRPLCNRIEAADSRGWQLHFTNKLPNTLFTGNKIETEDLRVVIIDANSKRIVTNGPLSSVKIEILVLDGDFGSDEKEDWTEDEFDACLIREREGKRPLVIGDLQITLRDGVGYFGDITFTDNSSWTRSRTFRLGAKVVRSTCNEEKIREARSTSFVVKDHRGELYKKHHPPSLSSEVWRLEKVGKDGAFHNRLASHKIETVQDFLRQFVTDPSFLRSVLGNNMSSRTWDIIVQHAQSCTLDDKKYTYYNAERQIGLLFNSIYKVIGVTFDGQNYQSVENLSAPDKVMVENLKQHAYRNQNNIIEINWPSVDASPLALPPVVTSPGSSLNVQLTDFPITRQDQSAVQVGFSNMTNALPYALEDHECMPDVAVMQSHLVQPFCSLQRNSFKMKGILTTYANDGNQWTPGGSLGSVVVDGHFKGEELSQFQMQSWFPAWGSGNGYVMTSGDETGCGFLPSMPDLSACMRRNCKRNMGWLKLRAAIKWGISVRRDLAARRAKVLQLGY